MLQFCPPAEAIKITGLSIHQLKKLRLSGQLELGIHWQYVNARFVAYNVPLITDWIANRHRPLLHEIAIKNYLAALPSSQPPVKSRAKTAA
jgi:hypothetical protein